jgi:hypothetical protein
MELRETGFWLTGSTVCLTTWTQEVQRLAAMAKQFGEEMPQVSRPFCNIVAEARRLEPVTKRLREEMELLNRASCDMSAEVHRFAAEAKQAGEKMELFRRAFLDVPAQVQRCAAETKRVREQMMFLDRSFCNVVAEAQAALASSTTTIGPLRTSSCSFARSSSSSCRSSSTHSVSVQDSVTVELRGKIQETSGTSGNLTITKLQMDKPSRAGGRSWLAVIATCIPPEYRESIIGDIVEDCQELRKTRQNEWHIRVYAVRQTVCAVFHTWLAALTEAAKRAVSGR